MAIDFETKYAILLMIVIIVQTAYVLGVRRTYKQLKAYYDNTDARFGRYQDQLVIEALKIVYTDVESTPHRPDTEAGLQNLLKLAKIRFEAWRVEFEKKNPSRVNDLFENR